MTNHESLKNATIEEMSHLLCDAMETNEVGDKTSCDICPMWSRCRTGAGHGNGWTDWLKENVKQRRR